MNEASMDKLEAFAWTIWALALPLAAAFAVSTLGGCSNVDVAAHQAEVTAAANVGHANDPGLPPEAREVGLANAVAWDVQRYVLTGEWRSPEDRSRALAALGVESEEQLLENLEAAAEDGDR